MAKAIKNECGSSGPVSVSAAEAVQGWTRCSGCGRIVKIRANREQVATVARHSRQARGREAAIREGRVGSKTRYSAQTQRVLEMIARGFC